MSDSDAIRARRARLMALALAGTTSVAATACACLSFAVPDAGVDAAAETDAPDDEDASSQADQ